MLPYYRESCDFSFMEIYADDAHDGCKTETCPERNPLLVLLYLRQIFSSGKTLSASRIYPTFVQRIFVR